MADKIVYYAVFTHDGTPKRRVRKKGGADRPASLYTTETAAKRVATKQGDTVVRLVFNPDEEPLFIRTVRYKPEI